MGVRIRAAKYGDIPAIYGIVVDAHQRSKYADLSELDERIVKATVMNAIQRHGGSQVGAHFVAVADNGTGIEGFIIGVLQPLYQIGKRLEATDQLWICREGAHHATAMRLLKAMHKWVPEGAIIRQGVTDAISNPAVTGRLLRKAGMSQSGMIYEKVKETSK